MLAEIGIASASGIDSDEERGNRYLRFFYADTHTFVVETAPTSIRRRLANASTLSHNMRKWHIEAGLDTCAIVKEMLPGASTLLGAIIGAAGAICGGWITAFLNYRQRKASTAVALLAEIEIIRSGLEKSLTRPAGPGWVVFFAKSHPAAMCPFYSNVAVDIGALSPSLLKQIVEFYTSFLATETVGHLDDDGGSRWIVNEESVQKLISLADLPCASLRALIGSGESQ